MSWFAVGAATLSVGSNLYSQKKAEKQQKKALAETKQGAAIQLAADTSAINIMKAAASRSAYDVIDEVLRVGGAEAQTLKQQISVERSKLAAQSEGLTSGISKGKQMVAFEMKARKLLNEVNTKATSQISQILEEKDSTVNELNNKLFAAQAGAESIFSKTLSKTSSFGTFLGAASAGLSGATAGLQLGTGLKQAGIIT